MISKSNTKETFLKKVKKTDSCWIFKGAISKTGYGKIGWHGKVVLAHRLSYQLHVGEIPDGLFICHKCDNRKCVNPDHLFTGTAQDNTNDMVNKGRRVARGVGKSKKQITSNSITISKTQTL